MINVNDPSGVTCLTTATAVSIFFRTWDDGVVRITVGVCQEQTNYTLSLVVSLHWNEYEEIYGSLHLLVWGGCFGAGVLALFECSSYFVTNWAYEINLLHFQWEGLLAELYWTLLALLLLDRLFFLCPCHWPWMPLRATFWAPRFWGLYKMNIRLFEAMCYMTFM